MDVEIGIGAVLDIASGSEVREAADGLLSELRKDRRTSFVRRTEIEASGTVAAAATTVTIDVGGPVAGRRWDVRRVCVSPTDPTNPPGGAHVYLFKGRTPNELTGRQYVSDTTAFPSEGEWNRQVELVNGEHIYVYVKGLTAGTLVVVTGDAHEYDMNDPSAA